MVQITKHAQESQSKYLFSVIILFMQEWVILRVRVVDLQRRDVRA
jgi:hypothetical protein